ncbi:MAG TPA: XdhC/CoxI family protein [Acidobacteriota bacterium]
MRRDAETIHRRISDLLRERRQFVVATIVEVKGSAPQRAGTKMIIHGDGTFEFTIGGGTFEAEVLQDAIAAFHEDKPIHREYRLTKDEIGMYCQGLVRVMFESYSPAAALLIFGGGHVGQALSRIAAATELFSVTVIDDRAQFANSQKHPDADAVVLTDRNFIKDVPATDDESYLVIVTRCHATDMLLVERYLQKSAAYLGLIGSNAKIRQFRKELSEKGISEKLLDRVHAPIGLPIGGKDPAEVAISILAELIQVKNQKSQAALKLEVKDRHA